MDIPSILALALSLLGSVACALYVRKRMNRMEAVLHPEPAAAAIPSKQLAEFLRIAIENQLRYEVEHEARQVERLTLMAGRKPHGAKPAHAAYDRDQRVTSVVIRVRSACQTAGLQPPADLEQLVQAAVK